MPERQLAVAVLINVEDEDFVYVLTNRVLDRLLNQPEASDQETSARPPAGWERIVGTYRTVDMAPDQLSLLEKFSQFRIEEVAGRLSMAIANGRTFTLEPGGAALTFVLHGGQGDGEMLRFREEQDGRLHGYASVLHIERVRPWERTWALAMGLVAGLALVGAAAASGLRARRRAARSFLSGRPTSGSSGPLKDAAAQPHDVRLPPPRDGGLSYDPPEIEVIPKRFETPDETRTMTRAALISSASAV